MAELDDLAKALDLALTLGPSGPRFAKMLFSWTMSDLMARKKIDDLKVRLAAESPGCRPMLRAAAQLCGLSEEQLLNEMKMIADATAANNLEELRAMDENGSALDPNSTLRLVPAVDTVLVIDDDPDMVESLAMMLEDHGFQVLTANDGVRGLEVFRQQRPAAVLTDILMPEQDGIGAIMEMRRERPEVKIIAISGSGRVGKIDFLTMAKKLGADATFEKGRSVNELLVLLKATLRH